MTESIHEAHRDGRHASTHPADRGFWINAGCTGCAGTLPGDVPDTEAEWVFEGPDPEVGIFGDSIVHPCAANVDFDEATSEVTIRPDVADARMVRVTTTFTCPIDGATESIEEQNPRDWFEEYREVPMFEVVHAGVVTVEL